MTKGKTIQIALLIGVTISIWSCKAKDDFRGREYAPNMYNSVAYEGLSQIKDESEGMWLSNRSDGKGEYYNSNIHNPHDMNMREPVAGTVKRSKLGYLPYRIPKDSIALAARILKNPLDSTSAVLADGQVLYSRYCTACHGATGQGDGKVGVVFMGVPKYNDDGRIENAPEGHIFHVITYGFGRMGSHASQVSVEDRWKIVRYVQELQNQ